MQMIDSGRLRIEMLNALPNYLAAGTYDSRVCPDRRRAMSKHAEGQFAAYGGEGGFAIVNLDQFKALNARFDHEGCEAVLVHFEGSVRSVVRHDDTFVRFGAGEFALFLPGASQQDTWDVTLRVRERVAANPASHRGETVAMSVTIGAVHDSGSMAFELDRWISSATEYLNEAKASGRSTAVFGALHS